MSNLQGLLLRNMNWWTSDQDILTILTEEALVDELVMTEMGFGETKMNGKSTGKCFLLFKNETAASKAQETLAQKLSEPGFEIKDLKIDPTPKNVTTNPFVQSEEKHSDRGRRGDDRNDAEYKRSRSKDRKEDSRNSSLSRRNARNESPHRKRRSRDESISPRRSRRDSPSPPRKSRKVSISPRRSRRDSVSPVRRSRNSRNYSRSPKRRSSRKSPSPHRPRSDRYRADSKERQRSRETRRVSSTERSERKNSKRNDSRESNRDLKKTKNNRSNSTENVGKLEKIDTTINALDDNDFVLPSPEERRPNNI
ncbi:hypothetical protein HDV01_005690 [Terramyces sp. JEL0728]|nr:hypothetical protein HDV01_005690 [Terramyces sp. JEL0728]